MNGRRNLERFKTTTPSKNNNTQRPFFAPNRHPDAMDVDRTRARLSTVEENNCVDGPGVQWMIDRTLRTTQGQNRGRGGPPFRPRGGFLQRGARPNFDNVQCYLCRQTGHIARYCPQHRLNQPGASRSRFTQANDYLEQEEPIQVARTIAADPQQRAHAILGKMAYEDDAIKDALIKELRKGEDFPNA